MNTLVNKLIKLKLVEGRSELLDFEELKNGKYSRQSADITEKKFRVLEEAGILNYEREEYGFRIEVLNMKELEEIQEVQEFIANTDDEIRNYINDIANELKNKTQEEAKEIICGYREDLNKHLSQ
ncbi:hypothetical protein GI482_00315 [Bacillus sp. N3536]|nr:hypothetical protein GI482_00315 [Bacillus sp. N3536]